MLLGNSSFKELMNANSNMNEGANC